MKTEKGFKVTIAKEKGEKSKTIAHRAGLSVAILLYIFLVYGCIKSGDPEANLVLVGCFIAPLISGLVYIMAMAISYGIACFCLGRKN